MLHWGEGVRLLSNAKEAGNINTRTALRGAQECVCSITAKQCVAKFRSCDQPLVSMSTQASTATPPTHLRTHTIHGLAPGPALLVLGAVHGNEVCGTKAIMQLLADIDAGN